MRFWSCLEALPINRMNMAAGDGFGAESGSRSPAAGYA